MQMCEKDDGSFKEESDLMPAVPLSSKCHVPGQKGTKRKRLHLQTVKEENDDFNVSKVVKSEDSESGARRDSAFHYESDSSASDVIECGPRTSTPSGSGSSQDSIFDFFNQRFKQVKQDLEEESFHDGLSDILGPKSPVNEPLPSSQESVQLISSSIKQQDPDSPLSISTSSIADLMDRDKWNESAGESSSSHLHSVMVKVPFHSAQRQNNPLTPSPAVKRKFQKFISNPDHKILKDFCVNNADAASSLLHLMDFVSVKSQKANNPFLFNGWLFEKPEHKQ
jgi:hypothetical protein